MGKSTKQEIRSFEDLEVWKQSRFLRKKISLLTKELPKEEQYRLADQIIRSSRSVTANIAEGFGRYHYQENIQYCRQARGSLYELLDHLTCALDEDYITAEVLEDLNKDIIRCTQLLNGFIAYLKRAKKDSSADEPQLPYEVPPIIK